MGLLNRLFGSTESIAIEIKEGEEFIIKHWKDYLATIPKKKKIINKLSLGDKFQSNLQELEKLLKLELVDISDEEKEELELISDLDAMGHSEKIERVHTLARCLGYAATKYKYAPSLNPHCALGFPHSQVALSCQDPKGGQGTSVLLT